MAAACLGAAVVGGVIGVVVTWRYAQSALVERASPAVPGGDETAAAPPTAQLQQLLTRAAADHAALEQLRRECLHPTPPAPAGGSQAAAPVAGPGGASKIAFPPALDARFREPAITEAFANALARTRITGEVAKTDCSEFPCLVHGEIAAVDGMDQARSDVRRLQEAAAAAYPGADFYLSMSEMKPDTDDGSGKILWTASFYPKDLPDDLRQQLNKRMRDRKNDYLDGQRTR